MKIDLRPWQPEDRQALAALCNATDRRYLSDRLPDPYTQQDAADWLARVAVCEGKNGVYRAVLADGILVGMISLEQKEDVCRIDGELGYSLADAWQGRGIMTRAVGQFCAAAFAELPLVRITAQVYAPNVASRCVLERNGFVQEGRMKNAVLKNGCLYDLCLYGLQKTADN